MQSYPFTSQVTYDEEELPVYDRAVDSAFLRRVFKAYFSDGVFYRPSTGLQVEVDSGMQVAVLPGAVHIQGAMGIEDSRRTLQLQAADTQDRIDTVVARLDLSLAARSIDLFVVKGTPAASPSPPALTRNATVWELGLANVFVPGGAVSITQQRITDTRLDASRCGAVAAPLDPPLDTGAYFTQLQATIDQLRQVIGGIEAGSEVMLQTVYAGSAPGVVAMADKANEANTAQSANTLGGKSLAQIAPRYSAAETAMPYTWTDGKTIYRRVYTFSHTDFKKTSKEVYLPGSEKNRSQTVYTATATLPDATGVAQILPMSSASILTSTGVFKPAAHARPEDIHYSQGWRLEPKSNAEGRWELVLSAGLIDPTLENFGTLYLVLYYTK